MSSVIFRSADWQRAAACRSADPELFFPVSTAGRSLEQVERAKAVCGTCIVRRQCLQYAIAANEVGVWGGMTEEERTRRASRSRLGGVLVSSAGTSSALHSQAGQPVSDPAIR
jgi:WhiB family transcriptional regulator, redox-sensing transcriptional regulator